MKPSVGRVVHYVARGSADGVFPAVCRAAIVTEVVPLEGKEAALAEVESWGEGQRCRVGLAVLHPDGLLFAKAIHQDEHSKLGGSWHWPEQVR